MGVTDAEREYFDGNKNGSNNLQYLAETKTAGHNSTDQRWCIVFASFFGCSIIGGLSFTCSLYYVQWLNEFNRGSALTSAIASLNVGLFSLFGPIASLLTNCIGFRWVLAISGFVSFAGLVASSLAPNIYVLLFSFGVIVGIGLGFAYTPLAVAPALHYPNHRVLVTGIGLSGIGFGSFVMPMVIEFTIEEYGWRGSLLIMSGVALNLCVTSALMFRHLRPANTFRSESLQSILSGSPTCPGIMQLGIFSSVHYVLYLVHIAFFTQGLSVMLVHLVAMVENQANVSSQYAGICLVAFGISNFLGRIAHGLLGQVQRVHIFSQYLIGYTLFGICAFLMTSTVNYWVLCIFACVGSFGSAVFGSCIPSILSEIAEQRYLTTAFGYVCLACGVGFTSGAPIAGYIYGALGNYKFSLYFTGAIILISVVIMIPTWRQSFITYRKSLSVSSMYTDGGKPVVNYNVCEAQSNLLSDN